MNEHKVTENIIQSGNSRTGQLICSCGVKTDETDLRKTPRRALQAILAGLHELEVQKKEDKPKKQNKSRKVKVKLERREPEAPLPPDDDDIIEED